MQAGVHMLLEKPVSVRPYEEVAEISERLDQYHRDNGVIIGIGYMLRYAAGVGSAALPFSMSALMLPIQGATAQPEDPNC